MSIPPFSLLLPPERTAPPAAPFPVSNDMASEYFTFKRFRIRHDRSSMKVGTDGVLLGAWADVSGTSHILDVGCGCGLIAIMAAQRSAARVTGLEIDAPSAAQAAGNAASSPFSARISIVCADVRTFSPTEKFDCILSNPPFFEESLLPPDPVRAGARHTSSLSFAALVDAACRLMTPQASFQMIVPATARTAFLTEASAHGLWLVRRTDVLTVPGKAPKRTLLHLSSARPAEPPAVDELPLCGPDGRRSPQYDRLAHDFYL